MSGIKKLEKNKIYRELKNVLLVIVGSCILGVATGIFLVPFNIVAGGVTGIAIILNKLIASVIPEAVVSFFAQFGLEMMDVYVSTLTWSMFLIGLFILGKNFAIKTVISSIFYPMFFTLTSKLVDPNVLGGFFDLKNSTDHEGVALILAAIFGGALVGAGCAITFLGGGSTGGVDIIALSICKFIPKLKSSVMIFIVDAAVVILGMFAIGDLSISLLGIVSAMVCAVVVDYIFVGSSSAFMAQIICSDPEALNLAIRKKLNRTTTLMTVKGGYTGEKKTMVMVLFTIREYSDVISTTMSIDRDAFVSVMKSHEINGEGWTFNRRKSRQSKGDAKIAAMMENMNKNSQNQDSENS